MYKILFLTLLISQALTLHTSIEEVQTTQTVQQLLRKTQFTDNHCPPDQSKTYCSGNQPCCKYGNKYGCCPYSYGVCCSDGTCVPSGGRC